MDMASIGSNASRKKQNFLEIMINRKYSARSVALSHNEDGKRSLASHCCVLFFQSLLATRFFDMKQMPLPEVQDIVSTFSQFIAFVSKRYLEIKERTNSTET